jgi:hypothetical protein
MSESLTHSTIEGLMAEILGEAGAVGSWRLDEGSAAGCEAKSLAKLDYAGPLRRTFTRREVDEIVAAARKTAWPRLNRDAVRVVSPRKFAKHWADLRIDFRPARLSWPAGLALMGFYWRPAKGLSKRPMICVNTAHHPVAVGAAFAHEMGHHVTADLFGIQKEPASFLLYAGYGEHLKDPPELAADILVALGVYPEQTARRIFGECLGRGRERGGRGTRDPEFENVLDYFVARYGLRLDSKLSFQRKLQYVAGLIHYSRLRRALLDEFDL